MKDCKTGEKDPLTKKAITKQTRLVIVSLKEAYAIYKDKNPENKVGFAKFSELRPEECILANQAGTHSVCVCTIHQNVKLMIEGTRLPLLTAKTETPINSYHDAFNFVVCKFNDKSCWLGHCQLCPPGVYKVPYSHHRVIGINWQKTKLRQQLAEKKRFYL